MTVTFEVSGLPKPQGSKIAIVYPPKDLVSTLYKIAKSNSPRKAFYANVNAGLIDQQSKALNEWRDEVKKEAIKAYGANAPIDEAVCVTATFLMPRPKNHYRTGVHAGTVKDSAPHFQITRPDVDKLERAIYDAITGVVFADDSQVVRSLSIKDYARHREHVGCRIHVEPVTNRKQLYTGIKEIEAIKPQQVEFPF